MRKITVIVEMYCPIEKRMKKQELTGEFQSPEEAKEFYAFELGIPEDEIKIK